jgi:hypothetical protein
VEFYNASADEGQSYNWRVWVLNITFIVIALLFSVAVSAFFCNQNRLKAKVRVGACSACVHACACPYVRGCAHVRVCVRACAYVRDDDPRAP